MVQNLLSKSVLRSLRPIYGLHDHLAESTICRLITKFETSGSVVDQITPVHHQNARLIENIAVVRDNVCENPLESIPRRAQEFGVSPTSI